jgi:hypothetical protein
VAQGKGPKQALVLQKTNKQKQKTKNKVLSSIPQYHERKEGKKLNPVLALFYCFFGCFNTEY